MDRRVTPPKRVTSPTWGPPPPCKQALSKHGYKTFSPSAFQSLSLSSETNSYKWNRINERNLLQTAWFESLKVDGTPF